MKKVLSFLWRWFKLLVGGYVILSVFVVILFRFVPVYFTPLMLLRFVQQLSQPQKVKLKKKWVPITQISPKLQLAVFCSEDQNFFYHHGFDFKAINKAIAYDEHHKKIRGASTISQQTAKNVFLFPGRNWIRKGFEAYFTVLIELFWSKKRILEVYLNIIELGKGIYGAEAASEYYFQKHVGELNAKESATIAAIIPDPLKWSAINPGPYVQSRQDWILQQMQSYGNMFNINNPP